MLGISELIKEFLKRKTDLKVLQKTTMNGKPDCVGVRMFIFEHDNVLTVFKHTM